MKKLMLFSLATVAAVALNAQINVGANFMLGLPMGDYNFGDADNQTSIPPGLGMGGGIEANYWFNDAFSAGLEVGFISFADNEIDADFKVQSRATAVPIILKGEYHFLDDAFRPYLGLGVGYGIIARAYEIDFFGPTTDSWDQSGLIISPRAGALYQVSDMIAINLSLQYNLMMNTVDGDLEFTTESSGASATHTETVKLDATNYLGINIGVLFNLFD